jgi:hypothetical protein
MPSQPSGTHHGHHTSSFYDDEAKTLFQRLGVSGGAHLSVSSSVAAAKRSPYSDLDPIYSHPQTGGTIFVGNQSAAASLPGLKNNKITHVVNCTNGSGEIPNFHEGALRYFRFPISDWHRRVARSGDEVLSFVAPLFSFIDSAINEGNNVLVHCLAGAHRAGTTGCLCLMHYEGLDMATAVPKAKSLRPIIDPICDFPRFLKHFEDSRKPHHPR